MARFRRLTREERYQIQALIDTGLSIRETARHLKRSPSTVCRELPKGISHGSYCPARANRETERLKRLPIPERRKVRGEIQTYILSKLALDWSPEQMAGRLRFERGHTVISTPTIYKFLEQNKVYGGELWKRLRILRKQRKDRKQAHWKPKEHLPGRVMIEKRPKIVELRKRLGDYERDTVRGRVNRAMLLTLVDRTSRLVKIERIAKNSSELVHQATVTALKNEPVKTITNDNGTEFSKHYKTKKALRAPVYFANSYRSWERGTNENTNGLIRQYFPKRKKKDPPNKKRLKQIERLLNNRPRKVLGFKTPAEVHRQLKSSCVALGP